MSDDGRPVTCPNCGDVAMFEDDHVWICESCDYETDDPFEEEDA